MKNIKISFMAIALIQLSISFSFASSTEKATMKRATTDDYIACYDLPQNSPDPKNDEILFRYSENQRMIVLPNSDSSKFDVFIEKEGVFLGNKVKNCYYHGYYGGPGACHFYGLDTPDGKTVGYLPASETEKTARIAFEKDFAEKYYEDNPDAVGHTKLKAIPLDIAKTSELGSAIIRRFPLEGTGEVQNIFNDVPNTSIEQKKESEGNLRYKNSEFQDTKKELEQVTSQLAELKKEEQENQRALKNDPDEPSYHSVEKRIAEEKSLLNQKLAKARTNLNENKQDLVVATNKRQMTHNEVEKAKEWRLQKLKNDITSCERVSKDPNLAVIYQNKIADIAYQAKQKWIEMSRTAESGAGQGTHPAAKNDAAK